MKGYYRDFEKITLSQFEKELDEAELLPSRRILKEDIRKRFAALEGIGIKNLPGLLDTLKTPVKLQRLTETTGIPEEYLIILKREISSNMPKPVPIKDFPSVSADAVRKLAELGIGNTLQLFPHIITKENRDELSGKTGIAGENILELTKLTDVCRIQWVGANFARLLVDSEYDTSQKVSRADYRELYPRLMKINEEKGYFKGKFGLNDMKLCVRAAGFVPDAIRY